MPDDSPSPEQPSSDFPSPESAASTLPRRPYWLHILLFLLTVLSTLCIGAHWQNDFNRNVIPFDDDSSPLLWSWALADWHRLALGIPFSACLLGILTAHELGHYVFCVRRRVYATWPFFIPFPSLIGTFGAFIRIKSPIRSRRALFDIGIAGPIAGFVVAVPVLIFGLLASKPLAGETANLTFFGFPLIFDLGRWLLAATGSQAAAAHLHAVQLYPHPVAIAAWVGMFATALNLIPGGQLDGGHILYSIHPRLHRVATLIAAFVLLPLAWYFWGGWLLWAAMLALSARHPEVPRTDGLGRKRAVLAVLALLMLALTFTPNPLPGASWPEISRQFLRPSKQ